MNFNIIRIIGLLSLTSFIYAGPATCALCTGFFLPAAPLYCTN